ncbi:MAG: M3 family peptidase, partial [Aquiluna sp.]
MTNPLLSVSQLEYELPDFAALRDEHYIPAFENAVQKHNEELDVIRGETRPTFENTVVALERSGQLLTAVMYVFYNKSASDTNDTIQAASEQIFPKFTAHMDSIRLDENLFGKLLELEKSQAAGDLELDAESGWLLKKYLEDFRHAGAELSEGERGRVAKINERLAELEAEFDRRLLADSNDLAINLPDSARLAGLSENEIESCKEAA